MKIKFISFFVSLVLIQNQLYKNWYKNLYCAGGFYELDNLISHPENFPIESDFSPIRFFVDYSNFDSQCENGNNFKDICTFQELIKNQLSKATNLMQQIVKVKRFTSNIYFSDSLLKTNLNLQNYDSKLNEGIACDYVISVLINEKVQVNNNKILGFQGDPRIIHTSTKRPILGIITIFNNDYNHMENKEHFFLHSFLHQIIHLLVFHPKLIMEFPIEGERYLDKKDYTDFRTMRYITTS